MREKRKIKKGVKKTVKGIGIKAGIETGVKTAGPPKLAKRSLNRQSTLRSGRTIGEKRERLETANERTLAREKDKKKAKRRILMTVFGFLFAFAVLLMVGFYLFGDIGLSDNSLANNAGETGDVLADGSFGSNGASAPSVEVFDEGTGREAVLTARMREYIGQAEADFAEIGLKVVRVVLPINSVREMDFYLEGVPGFLKLILSREPGVSVEDAERMLKYLDSQGIKEFSYIDLRLDGRAYWK